MSTTVLSPKGKLMQITEAVPVCEKLVKFNGKRKLLMERAMKPETATAVALRIVQETHSPFACQELLVGNLPAGKVEEILKSLLTQGYFDFTAELTYQNVKRISQISFDQGTSQPYTTEDIPESAALGQFCGNMSLMFLTAHDIDNDFGLCCGSMSSAPGVEDVNVWDEEDELADDEEGLDE